jgi:hypothetical protein
MAPTLWIKAAMNGVHELGYWDADAMTRRGKPRGASHLVLLCHVGDEPIADPAGARYVGAFTRYPMRVQDRPADGGRTASYFAAWRMRSGAQSAWSAGVSMTIVSSALTRTQLSLAA